MGSFFVCLLWRAFFPGSWLRALNALDRRTHACHSLRWISFQWGKLGIVERTHALQVRRFVTPLFSHRPLLRSPLPYQKRRVICAIPDLSLR